MSCTEAISCQPKRAVRKEKKKKNITNKGKQRFNTALFQNPFLEVSNIYSF